MSLRLKNHRSNLRRLCQCSVVGLLCGTLPIGPHRAVSQVRAQPIASDSICRGIERLSTAHPDVKIIRALASQYDVPLPVTIAWDGDSITYYEVEQLLRLLQQQSQEFSQADRQTLQRLESRYRLAEDPAAGSRYSRFGGSPSLLSPSLLSKGQPNLSQMMAPPSVSKAIAPAMLDASQTGVLSNESPQLQPVAPLPGPPQEPWRDPSQPANTEGYRPITDNPFLLPSNDPRSTFSIDVDTAAYSNVRRFISQGTLPPPDAVRLEELINYFPYNYRSPQSDQPFSVNTTVTPTPWNSQHRLVRIGLQGQALETPPPSNLVFLLDVSGSMNSPDKLPLLKQSMCLLVDQLSAQDKVSIVVYAGSAGTVLPPTAGDQKRQIIEAIDVLAAGGSTAGSQGIQLAYEQAQKAFIKGGNNRVILATDGDFNVGPSSDAELVRMIEQKRDQGVFLTVLGFGTGNYKDAKMEQLANQGNGNYAYLDTLAEANKVLVKDLRGTLFTIAKDVKIQVEFNPAKVQAYRLIGYENRALRDQDFNDDMKDAGEIGAGHRVTALYEVVPIGVKSTIQLPSIDPLKYQAVAPPSVSTNSQELMQVKLRYKAPDSDTSQLIVQPILDRVSPADPDSQFAAAVALFGMVLRDSKYKGEAGIDQVLSLAQSAQQPDPEGYRAEFIRLVQRYEQIRDRQANAK